MLDVNEELEEMHENKEEMSKMIEMLGKQAKAAHEPMEEFLKQVFPDSHYKRVWCYNDEKRMTSYA